MYYVYILAQDDNKMVYTGVTNDLHRRVAEHRREEIPGFTRKYHIHKLVYFEEYSDVKDAIKREKQIKHWTREKKNALVESRNPRWRDLIEQFDPL